MISSSPPAQAQDHTQVGFEHLQRRRLLSLSGQPVLGLHLLHSKEDFPHIQMAVPVFQFVPVSGHHCEETGHHCSPAPHTCP